MVNAEVDTWFDGKLSIQLRLHDRRKFTNGFDIARREAVKNVAGTKIQRTTRI